MTITAGPNKLTMSRTPIETYYLLAAGRVQMPDGNAMKRFMAPPVEVWVPPPETRRERRVYWELACICELTGWDLRMGDPP